MTADPNKQDAPGWLVSAITNLFSNLPNFDLMDYLSIWGALLSSILAIIKIHEFLNNQPKIEISFDIKNIESRGNTISVRNLYHRQIIVAYWEVFLAKNLKSQRIMIHSSMEHNDGDFIIAENSSHTIEFLQQDFFVVTPDFLSGRSIYFQINIAGRKPEISKIFPFNDRKV